jgi:hypothetical protein
MRKYPGLINRKAEEMKSPRTTLTQESRVRTSKVLLLAVIALGLQIVITPANAADCTKGSAAKKAACTALNQSKVTDPLRTVNDSGAQAQKAAGQSAQNTKQRVWTPKAVTNCVRGQITVHLNDPMDSCPRGFIKK